jgi:hypothetical protein
MTDLKLNTIQGVTALVNRVAESMLVSKEQTPTNMGAALDAVITMIEKRGSAEVKDAMLKVREATQLTNKPNDNKESLV